MDASSAAPNRACSGRRLDQAEVRFWIRSSTSRRVSNKPQPLESAAPVFRRKALGQLAFGSVLAAAFLYFFLRGTELEELAGALRAADPGWLTLSLLATIATYWVQALRWQCYLRPVGRVPMASSFNILIIGNLVSNVLPGRLGDIVARPLLMRRWEGIPAVKTLATIAVERLFDVLMLVGCLAAYFCFFQEAGSSADFSVASATGISLFLACALATTFLIALHFHRRTLLGLLERALQPLSERLRRAVMEKVHAFADGLELFRDLRNTALSIFYSFATWFAHAVAVWTVVKAMGISSFRPSDTLLMIGLGGVGIAIPTPGGIGSLHYALFWGLERVSDSPDDSLRAAAILIWAIGILPVTLLGFLALARRGLDFRAFGTISEPEREHPPG